MKLIKIFGIFVVLLAAVIMICWVLGTINQQTAIDLAQKSGAVIGILFIVTVILTSLSKPQANIDPQDKK